MRNLIVIALYLQHHRILFITKAIYYYIYCIFIIIILHILYFMEYYRAFYSFNNRVLYRIKLTILFIIQ